MSPTTNPRLRRWLSQNEAADYLGVSPRTIRNYIARGFLPASRIKGSRLARIDAADLEAMLRSIPTVGGGQRAI